MAAAKKPHPHVQRYQHPSAPMGRVGGGVTSGGLADALSNKMEPAYGIGSAALSAKKPKPPPRVRRA